jgi:uncharacterized membrane protein YkvA (DUF1232 family)
MAAMAYLLFPIDLLRDFIPVAGLVDDVVLLWLAFTILKNLSPRHVVEEHRRIFPDATPSAAEKEGGQVITDVKYRIIDKK